MFAKQLSIGLMLALPLAAIGCGRDDGPPAPMPPRSEVSSGPVELTVQFDPAAPSLADQGVLTVTVSREPGVVVERPEFGPRFGDFRLIDEREEIPAVEKDREITRYVYTLEPIRPGRAALWPVDVAFTDARPGGDGKRHILSSEPLAVEVATEVASESPTLAELRPESGPIAVPFSRLPLVLWSLVAVVTFAACWWVVRRRRLAKRAITARPLTPAEIAYRDLRKIVDDALAQRDVKLFYIAVTGVVRRFIEQTTSIRAPERTTEEFLREISARRTFPAEENRRLRDFLEAADLVKFAAHRPRPEDIDASLDRAREFIDARRDAMAAAEAASRESEPTDTRTKEAASC